MAVSYPTGLNIPLVSGYSHSDAEKTRSYDVETGPPRIELISEDGYARYKVKWIFSQDNFRIFEGWFNHDLNFGKLAFNLLVKTGAGLKKHEMNFIGSYSPSLKGKLWVVSASLASINKRYDTLADYNTAKASL